jgi:hypothetical protein
MQDGNTHSANTFQGSGPLPTEKPQCQNHEGKNRIHQPLTNGPYRDEGGPNPSIAKAKSHYAHRKVPYDEFSELTRRPNGTDGPIGSADPELIFAKM